MSIASKMEQLCTESGVVTPVSDDALTEVLVDENQISREPGLEETLEHASLAGEIADDLDVLADKADVLAGQDEKYANDAVKEAEVISLESNFAMCLRARKLGGISSYTTESSQPRKIRVEMVRKEARRVASATRKMHEGVLGDYSQEGAIMEFFRRDKSRLAKADVALTESISLFNQKKSEIVENPVVVHGDAHRKFLMVDGKPVHSLKEAIEHDIHWLKSMSGVISKVGATIAQEVAAAEHGDHENIAAKLRSLYEHGVPGTESLMNVQLLGNHAVADGKRHQGTNPHPGLGSRLWKWFVDSSHDNLKNTTPPGLISLGGTVLGLVAARHGHYKTAGVGLSVGLAAGVSTVYHGVKSTFGSAAKLPGAIRGEHTGEEEKADCVATAADLEKIGHDVLSLKDITSHTLEQELAKIATSSKGLPPLVKKEVHHAVAVLSSMANVVYEHAIYLTVNTASLLYVAAKA